MNAFSQLNGHASLPHGGRSGLSAGWSGAAFSQLNAFDFFGASAQKTHPPLAWAFSQLNAPQGSAIVRSCNSSLSGTPFSQLNGHTSLSPGERSSSQADEAEAAFSQLNAFDFFGGSTQKTRSLRAWAFSQLNAWSVGGWAPLTKKRSISTVARGGRVFSQLNAEGITPLGQAQKNAFAEVAFSQLNALGCVSSRACRSAACPGPQPARRRLCFRGLKPRAYLYTTHEPRTTRGSVHLEPEIWRNRMK